MDLNQLLDYLNRLLPAQFDEMLFRLDVPRHYLSQGAGQATVAAEVIRYVQQHGRINELVEQLPNGARPNRRTSSDSGASLRLDATVNTDVHTTQEITTVASPPRLRVPLFHYGGGATYIASSFHNF